MRALKYGSRTTTDALIGVLAWTYRSSANPISSSSSIAFGYSTGHDGTSGADGKLALSTSSTVRPRAPSRAARLAPAGRPPTMITS
jgi:hypothetical protein